MDHAPRERPETLRTALRDALRAAAEPQTLRELSQALGASERDLIEHLEHLSRSLAHSDDRLVIVPARCLGCGFELEPRFKKAGRCPACKSTRIALPRFGISQH